MMIPKPTRSRKTVTKRIGSIRGRANLARRMHCQTPLAGSLPTEVGMGKAAERLEHVCRECGFRTVKWFGKCAGCGAFGSVSQEERRPLRTVSAVVPIDQVPLETGRRDRTGIGELDRALGGGLVPGAVVLLAGDPGIGKSTLLLTALDRLSRPQPPGLYISRAAALPPNPARGGRRRRP